MPYRKESDTLGEVSIPEDKLWGPQTQRSLENFKIGSQLMPIEVIQALALIKESVAEANLHFGLLSDSKCKKIVQVAKEIQDSKLNDHFPLSVWQTGSGTQTNMNVNEVIAYRSNLSQNSSEKLHPNDDVNKSQSSNDTFPSAMRIATYKMIQTDLIEACSGFERVLSEKCQAFKTIVKIGRTHLMDAVPLTLAQEFSAFQQQIFLARQALTKSLAGLLELPIGGTAVGTGLNTPVGFSEKVCKILHKKTHIKWESAKNKFAHIAAHDPLVQVSGHLKALACSLMKIANDIRLLGSGPRSGLAELILPANEPGSSIMPGKVNPTQCEALTMVCAEVIGRDVSVTYGASQGHLQLNTFKPLIIFNVLTMIRLLADSMNNFRQKCLKDLQANESNIKDHLNRSLMLVTALNPHIGYERAADVAKQAFKKGTTLKEEILHQGLMSSEEFDKVVQADKMIQPNLK